MFGTHEDENNGTVTHAMVLLPTPYHLRPKACYNLGRSRSLCSASGVLGSRGRWSGVPQNVSGSTSKKENLLLHMLLAYSLFRLLAPPSRLPSLAASSSPRPQPPKADRDAAPAEGTPIVLMPFSHGAHDLAILFVGNLALRGKGIERHGISNAVIGF